MKLFKRLITLFAWFILFPVYLYSLDECCIYSKQREYNIDNSISFYADESSRLNINDILKQKQPLFKKITLRNLNFGFTESSYWFKISLINKSGVTQNLILSINKPNINHVDFYLLRQNKLIDSVHTGEKAPFKSRRIIHRNYLFNLSMEPEIAYECYIRVNNDGDSIIVPLALNDYNTYFNENNKETMLIGFIFGLFLFVILYNIFPVYFNKR